MKPIRLKVLLSALSILVTTSFSQAQQPTPERKVRTMEITAKYLNIPLGYNPWGTMMTLSIDGEPLGRFGLDLQEQKPYFWGFIDVERYKGKKLEIVVDNIATDLSTLTNSDQIVGHETLYTESLRPQYHFTSRRGWFNDPNGLIWYEGVYHLFYQHNPMSVFWGNMSWGHATSPDLVHWQEQPHVLFPLATTGECFTGACFVDKENLLGLQQDERKPIIAFYLRTASGLSYAYSLDGGATFTDYEHNPIVAKAVGNERIDSPKPMFHAESGKWVAPVFDHRFFAEENRNSMTVSIYSSEDLRSWQKESDIGEVDLNAECPDLFPLPLDGNKEDMRWLLLLGNASYVVGNFDGKYMYTEGGEKATYQDFVATIPAGCHYYASMTYDNIPEEDGRRIQIGWMKKVFNDPSTYAGMPFNQQMSLPMVWTLRSTELGPRVFINPAKEVESLRGKPLAKEQNVALVKGVNPLAGIDSEQVEICLTAKLPKQGKITLNIRGIGVEYDAAKEQISVPSDGVVAHLAPTDGRLSLRAFVDTRSMEIVAGEGRVYIPLLEEFPTTGYNVEGSEGVVLEDLALYPLASIWHK